MVAVGCWGSGAEWCSGAMVAVGCWLSSGVVVVSAMGMAGGGDVTVAATATVVA
nr:hypothetical protein [Tanacetum cinerariifolium]